MRKLSKCQGYTNPPFLQVYTRLFFSDRFSHTIHLTHTHTYPHICTPHPHSPTPSHTHTHTHSHPHPHPHPHPHTHLLGVVYPNDRGVQQLSLAIAACHEQPSLVRRDTVATEEDCFLRVEENVVGLCADEWTRAGKRGIGREDKGRSKELSARIGL